MPFYENGLMPFKTGGFAMNDIAPGGKRAIIERQGIMPRGQRAIHFQRGSPEQVAERNSDHKPAPPRGLP